MKPHPRLVIALLALLFTAAIAACDPSALGGPGQTATTSVPAGPGPVGTMDAATARTRLAELVDATPGPLTGYVRDCDKGAACVFGRPWLDVDGDGCDQRSQVLARDLTGVERKPGRCSVTAGTLHDPYTGLTLTNVSKIQIDHVVPLAEMWRSGAAGWTPDQRAQAANNLANLVAVQGTVNEQKGDKTPDVWLPPNAGFHCTYARIYITVKVGYHLTTTPPERTALSNALATCT